MISMNSRPPRAIAARKVDSVPKVKARMRNRARRNIGSATRLSMTAKAISEVTAPAISTSTRGLAHPVGAPPYGLMPKVTATMIRIRPSAKVTLPHQSIAAGRGLLRSSSLR